MVRGGERARPASATGSARPPGSRGAPRAARSWPVRLAVVVVLGGLVVLVAVPGWRSPGYALHGVAAAPLTTVGGVIAGDPVAPPDSRAHPPALPRLPRGGVRLFPRFRLVGFSGSPSSPAFGRLGVGDLDQRVSEIERLGRAYAHGHRVMPVLELIAVIAQRKPGDDGRFRVRVGGDVIQSYLDAARRHGALLLLNIQPGRAHFLDEVKALAPWLREPDVGLALDPEWAVGPGQVPGRVFGHTTGREIDSVATFLQGICQRYRLPDKVLVVHQLAPQVIPDFRGLRPHPGVVVIKSVDGIGSPAEKTSTWNRLVARLPAVLHPGFKLFFAEDRRSGPLMSPAQVLALHPTPEYVLYE